jgi:hypothetical protein
VLNTWAPSYALVQRRQIGDVGVAVQLIHAASVVTASRAVRGVIPQHETTRKTGSGSWRSSALAIEFPVRITTKSTKHCVGQFTALLIRHQQT